MNLYESNELQFLLFALITFYAFLPIVKILSQLRFTHYTCCCCYPPPLNIIPTMKHLTLNPSTSGLPTKDHLHEKPLPQPISTQFPPSSSPENKDNTNGSLYFIGTATTLLSYAGLRILTDPNFLHAGDHVHLGPGVSATRRTNPAVAIEELPRIDLVLLSHYHEDHFDRVVEEKLRRDLPIVTTEHARGCLVEGKGEEGFTAVEAVREWESLVVDVEEGEGEDSRVGEFKW